MLHRRTGRLRHPDQRPQSQDVAKLRPEPRSSRLNLGSFHPTTKPSAHFPPKHPRSVGVASWGERGPHSILFPRPWGPGAGEGQETPRRVFILPGPVGRGLVLRAQGSLASGPTGNPDPTPPVSRPLDKPVLWLRGPGTSGTFVRDSPPFAWLALSYCQAWRCLLS